MEFSEQLNKYISEIGCTPRELSDASGLSVATISRYKTGNRTPVKDSEHFENLIGAIVRLAAEKNIPDVSDISVRGHFYELLRKENDNFDFDRFRIKLNTLISTLGISINELSRYLNYDNSHLSRIRSGQRKPSHPIEFAERVSKFIAANCMDSVRIHKMAELTGTKNTEMQDKTKLVSVLTKWLSNDSDSPRRYAEEFVKRLDSFNIDEYTGITDDKTQLNLEAAAELKGSNVFYGIDSLKTAEVSFVVSTIKSKSMDDVTICSDMSMSAEVNDPEFTRRFMQATALMLKKGLKLRMIHDVERPVDEMMYGLEVWIPMYMTGQIEPYYLESNGSDIYRHELMCSGDVAFWGEAIDGHLDKSRFHLTDVRREVDYYKERAEALVEKASPLMKLIRKENEDFRSSFLLRDAEKHGVRKNVLSTPPIYTVSDDLLDRILTRNNISESDKKLIFEYISRERGRVESILSHSTIKDMIPDISLEEFTQQPIYLSLSGIFYDKDIFYTYEEYKEHMELTRRFAREHKNYSVSLDRGSVFRNIQIFLNEGRWVMISKNKTPAIHFLIEHSRLRTSIESMVELF